MEMEPVKHSVRKGYVSVHRFALIFLVLFVVGALTSTIVLAVFYAQRGNEIDDLRNEGLASTSTGSSSTQTGQVAPSPVPPDVISHPPASKCSSRLTGTSAMGGWRDDYPGVCRYITVSHLPSPGNSTTSRGAPVPRPPTAWPRVPPGFRVDLFYNNLTNPRLIRVAPDGSIFVAESSAHRVRILRSENGATRPRFVGLFVSRNPENSSDTTINRPFGIAFHPPGPNPEWIYIANTNNVIRYAYQNGDTVARGNPEVIVSSLPVGGHWTRDVAFSADGSKMFVAVGSLSNVQERPQDNETNRAAILEYKPDGSGYRIFGSGIRNPVGLAVSPITGAIWTSVNERDGLGDHLVPDYITHVEDGGFYGWPWYYMGTNLDPRHNDPHPDLRNRTIIPDVLLQSHSASLQMEFYTGTAFPVQYHGDAFASEHGSWNRQDITGYKVIRLPMVNGRATGEYEDFVTGFITDDGSVWGRPVGVTMASDGALLVTDDGSNSIWRIAHVST